MAISTTNISTTSDTETYTSTDESAMTFMSLCNYSGSLVLVDVHIVPNGDGVTTSNLFIKELEIIAGDTYVVYQGGEKIVFSNGDKVYVTASAANAISVITSSVQV